MHGGAANSGAPRDDRNGRYEHGHMTREAIKERRYLLAFVMEMRTLAKSVLGD